MAAIITVLVVGDGKSWQTPRRPDVSVDYTVVTDNGTTMTISVSDADARHADVQAAIARASA